MATTITRPGVAAPAHAEPAGYSQPAYGGVMGWITTVDHKRIGVMYGVTAFIFFIVGGLEALMIRAQLAVPDNTFVTADAFNQLFTMHGTTMIFLFVMPMSVAFFNFVVPLQIGARDVAFPRLNAFSYWTFLFGAIFMNFSYFWEGMPDGGWFGYVPLTTRAFSPSTRIDFWVLGLQVLGVASLAGAFNFLVTIINMRAPGMTLMRMPIFTWNTFVTSFLLILAFPAITVALILLAFDRFYGTNFYNAANGGDPLLWQHLFWIFGHPEVYILILPAMGIVSEILPVFSRKPLFGYPFVVYATVAIGFIGFGVWAHHMFTTGMGPVVNSFFAAATMLIAVPTGVKICNWMGTMYGGNIRLTTAMLFAISFVSMFTIGGLSGVMHALPPVDRQHQDTYFVVAHFHYVLFGGAVMALFGGFYFWWPKLTNRMLNETLGKWNFWLMLIGYNFTFGPMHFLGVDGMPRRIYTYSSFQGWNMWNFVITLGALTLGVGVLFFIAAVIKSLSGPPENVGDDPWDAATLEWGISSPPPVYNFGAEPTVSSRDPLWALKGRVHEEDGHGHVRDWRKISVDTSKIHLPNPSFFPLIAAAGLTLVFAGLIFSYVMSLIGAVYLLAAIGGWAMESTG
ncbi:MAG: cytochrome c oxidase subunit I [Chloroflexota bacterium]